MLRKNRNHPPLPQLQITSINFFKIIVSYLVKRNTGIPLEHARFTRRNEAGSFVELKIKTMFGQRHLIAPRLFSNIY